MFADTENKPRTALSTIGHCIDCPAARAGQLRGLIGGCTEQCAFETFSAEARQQLPVERFPPGCLVMVRRGAILRQRQDGTGSPVSVDIVGPGASFVVGGRNAEEFRSHPCLAIDRSLYCVLGEEHLLDEVRKNPVSAIDLHRIHCEMAYRLERLSEARGRPNVRSRIAATLCTLADTLSPYGERRTRLPSALLQRDIGTLASTRHESVCRILRDFSGENLVQHGPDGIEILNHNALAAL